MLLVKLLDASVLKRLSTSTLRNSNTFSPFVLVPLWNWNYILTTQYELIYPAILLIFKETLWRKPVSCTLKVFCYLRFFWMVSLPKLLQERDKFRYFGRMLYVIRILYSRHSLITIILHGFNNEARIQRVIMFALCVKVFWWVFSAEDFGNRIFFAVMKNFINSKPFILKYRFSKCPFLDRLEKKLHSLTY